MLNVGPHRYKVTGNPKVLSASDRKQYEVAAVECSVDPRPGARFRIFGMHFPTKHLIFVSPDQDVQSRREIILHELLHALWALNGFHEIGRLARHEEQVVTALAPQLLTLLRENPNLVDYLVDAQV